MLTKKLEKAFNQQINAEMYSAYMYLAMAAWLKGENLDGMSSWMQAQAQEEMGHAMKFYGQVFERGGKVTLAAIDGPPTSWKSVDEVWGAVLAHERKVTGLINGLMDLAIAENDHASRGFLQWFVSEQVEEESSVDGVIQKLKMIGKAPGALFMLDRALAARAQGGH